MNHSKYTLLKNGLLYDAIGMLTMFIPVIGPFLDILWAPYAAKTMRSMYSGEQGKIAAIVVFIEEILPISDFIPTFTLMWIYTFVVQGKTIPTPQTIEVEVTNK
jgi:F0F1-type ATP synthase assembly protein I